MKRSFFLLGSSLLAAVIAFPASAQSGFCKTTNELILDALKAISLLATQDGFDDSAPRAAMRAAQAGAAYQQINQNLGQLKDHTCPAFPYPISEKLYQSPAALCSMILATSQMRNGFASEKDSPECDRSKWKFAIPRYILT